MKLFYAFVFFSIPLLTIAQTVTTYNRAAWTVASSSEELTGDLPNGPASKMLDGDNTTYWVSRHSSNFAEYPHTLVFDMQVTQPVNQLYYVPRAGANTNPYAGSVSFGDDGTNFGTEMPVIFSNTFGQNLINLPVTQNHRYFRITVSQNYGDHTAGSTDITITTLAEVGAIYNATFDGTLTAFTTQSKAGGIQLDWSTGFEINSSSYNITRSADAVNFTAIGNITATGTASTTASYSYTDAAPLDGINFYRLELVHTSGPTETSVIKNAEFPLVTYSSTQSKNLNLFYFLPAGKAPWPDFKHRLDTVFLQLQNYYQSEMQRNGRGNKTFGLVTDASHKHIKIIIVHGRHPFDYYSTNPGGGQGPAILAEINEYIAANPSAYYGAHSQIVSPAFGYDASTGIVDEQVPVYGSGRNCFSLDYPDLKWSLLGTGGVLGEAATVNIGGTAHEAGHGLNLSHNKLKVSETALGTALMSDGNYTFGKSVTSLTATDAAILNRNQIFNADGLSYYGPTDATISSVHACYSASKNSIIVAGRTTTTGSPITDVAIYNDPNNGTSPGMGDNNDYDAPTWTAPIIGTDRFYIEMPITELQIRDSSLYEMKIVTIQQDGNLSTTKYHFDFANNLPELTDPSFTPISANITASLGSNGEIAPGGITTINCAGNQTYTITPHAGYAISNVLVDGVAKGVITTYTFSNVVTAHTISATFVASTLPVKLVNFNANLQGGNNALITWATASEFNSLGYDIEMSKGDDKSFNKVSFVAGKGTTALYNNYQSVINNLTSGIYYFRLKMIDIDGNFTYSTLRSLVVTGQTGLLIIYPNPSADGRFIVQIDGAINKIITVTVTNAIGQLVTSTGATNYAGPFTMSINAGAGIYNVMVTLSNGSTILRKIVTLK